MIHLYVYIYGILLFLNIYSPLGLHTYLYIYISYIYIKPANAQTYLGIWKGILTIAGALHKSVEPYLHIKISVTGS